VAQVIIENPTPNSPFKGPARHFKSSGEGITKEIVEADRVSSYLIPVAKPKKKDKAEIDEAAWSSLYSTVSRPFDPPKSGKIAIKVINYYGDEVLKVYEVE
jgi:hypothetical protein